MEQIYTNRPKGRDFTVNFFRSCNTGIKSVQLACPFFTDSTPIEILRDKGSDRISLLVRLCEATSPYALAKAKACEGVEIRFFTSSAFHAKFYILDHTALVGSANLTDAGLRSNRELSLTIPAENEQFDDIVMLFDELWSAASVLTDESLERFRIWRLQNKPQSLPDIDGIDPCGPITIDVNTQRENRTRTYLENFRSLYVETLIPAHKTIQKIYKETGVRHRLFEDVSSPFDFEIDRFLFWAKSNTTDEKLHEHPIRNDNDRHENIRQHISEWLKLDEISLIVDRDRIHKIIKLRQLFGNEKELQSVELETILELLQGGCAAFSESLYFVPGGLEYGISAFKQHNSIDKIRTTFHHLVFGDGDYAQRVYDCIYHSEYKLHRWGKNCTLELFGWVNNNNVPPFNFRTQKALRYLGFDVLT